MANIVEVLSKPIVIRIEVVWPIWFCELDYTGIVRNNFHEMQRYGSNDDYQSVKDLRDRTPDIPFTKNENALDFFQDVRETAYAYAESEEHTAHDPMLWCALKEIGLWINKVDPQETKD